MTVDYSEYALNVDAFGQLYITHSTCGLDIGDGVTIKEVIQLAGQHSKECKPKPIIHVQYRNPTYRAFLNRKAGPQ